MRPVIEDSEVLATANTDVPEAVLKRINDLNDDAWRARRGHTNRSTELATEALRLSEKYSYLSGIAHARSTIGTCYTLTGDHNAALAEFEEALKIFRQLRDEGGEARVLNRLGRAHVERGEFPSALQCLATSLNVFEKLKDYRQIANTLDNIGVVHYYVGDYATALDYIQRALQIVEEHYELREYFGAPLNNISGIYDQLGDREKAIDYMLRATESFRAVGDGYGEASCLTNLGEYYRQAGRIQEALELQLQAVARFEEGSLKYGESWAQLNLGKVYQSSGGYDQALQAYNSAIRISQAVANKPVESDASIGLGETLYEMGETERAIEVLKQAHDIAEQAGLSEYVYKSHLALSRVYESTGCFQLALTHYQEFYELKQKLIGEKASRQVLAMMAQTEIDRAHRDAESQRLKRMELDNLLSGVSHELKTPLTLIRLYSETLLYGEEFEDDSRRNYYRIITRESERLSQMVDNVLNFSSMDRGVKTYSFQIGDLAAAVAETLEIHIQYLKRYGFEVDIHIPPDLPPARFDRAGIDQVLINLLDNAVKYSRETKQVVVSLEESESQLVLAVKDRGIGIPPSARQKIFEQFYRVPDASVRGGYGLGLFLVSEIVKAHGGAVEARSREGGGSAFIVTIPVADH